MINTARAIRGRLRTTGPRGGVKKVGGIAPCLVVVKFAVTFWLAPSETEGGATEHVMVVVAGVEVQDRLTVPVKPLLGATATV